MLMQTPNGMENDARARDSTAGSVFATVSNAAVNADVEVLRTLHQTML